VAAVQNGHPHGRVAEWHSARRSSPRHRQRVSLRRRPSAELRYRVEIRSLRRRGQIADRHVFHHASAQRTHLGRRKTTCLKGWALTPSILSEPSALNRLESNWLHRPTQSDVRGDGEKEQSVAVGEKASTPKAGEALQLRATDTPIPTEYGVYVVSDGRLTELEQLPIKVPDPRVAISATFSTRSRTHVPMGKVQFVAFRRDLVNGAPDGVSVRIVAQVMRALTLRYGWARENDGCRMIVGNS
jgi:hypothetical protein